MVSLRDLLSFDFRAVILVKTGIHFQTFADVKMGSGVPERRPKQVERFVLQCNVSSEHRRHDHVGVHGQQVFAR
jgi:hypothetical protein